jgi:16S rRNA (guanine1516-N2)-methyltransferase
LSADGVEIRLPEVQLGFQHSFVTGGLPLRARQSAQALIKACNNKQRNIKKILDLTAGWGIDSFTLAWHGQQVTLLEQNELLYAIVAYSLSRLGTDNQSTAVAARMSIENTDASSYLQSLDANHEYDCIYLDPMFPRHKSGAKPAKEMQILQALTTNVEIDSCFELALQNARRRVVVKRPARAARLSALKPDLVYREKTIRFDVYLTR